MSMYTLPFLSELAGQLGTTALDDSVDALHCFITAFFFAFSALLISVKTNAGTPIECWLPQTYSGSWGEFSEAYCFLKDTYWYPSDASLNEITENHKELHRLNYYQWSSIYLTIACMIFMFPKFVWKLAQNHTNVSLPYFCEVASMIRHNATEQRKEKVTEMVTFLRRQLNTGSMYRKLQLTFVFMLVKVLYLLLAVGQFFFLAFFLGQGWDIFWGWRLFENLMNGITWETTGMFPRVTFCDFTIREMAGNNREETIECMIGLNEFNEKIFLFLWFWLLFVIGVSCLGIIQDIYLIHKSNVVGDLLRTIRIERNDHPVRGIDDFINDFLGYDGKLVIHFVKRQSALVAEEFTLGLYEKYLEDKEKVLRNNKMVPIYVKEDIV